MPRDVAAKAERLIARARAARDRAAALRLMADRLDQKAEQLFDQVVMLTAEPAE